MAKELRRAAQLKWRSFLASQEGIEGLLFLRESAPRIGKGPEHEMVFDAGKAGGYLQALDAIRDLAGKEEAKNEKFDND